MTGTVQGVLCLWVSTPLVLIWILLVGCFRADKLSAPHCVTQENLECSGQCFMHLVKVSAEVPFSVFIFCMNTFSAWKIVAILQLHLEKPCHKCEFVFTKQCSLPD